MREKRDERGEIKRKRSLTISGPNCSHGSHWGFGRFKNRKWNMNALSENFCLSFSFFFIFSFDGRQYKYVKKNYSALEGYFKTTWLRTHTMRHAWKIKENQTSGTWWRNWKRYYLKGHIRSWRGWGVFTGATVRLRNPRPDARKVSFLIQRNE
jgi:hypothetical protein